MTDSYRGLHRKGDIVLFKEGWGDHMFVHEGVVELPLRDADGFTTYDVLSVQMKYTLLENEVVCNKTKLSLFVTDMVLI